MVFPDSSNSPIKKKVTNQSTDFLVTFLIVDSFF